MVFRSALIRMCDTGLVVHFFWDLMHRDSREAAKWVIYVVGLGRPWGMEHTGLVKISQ